MLNGNFHTPLIAAAAVFAFVALMHLLRLIYRLPIKIANKSVPLWASGVALLVALLLSIWMMSASFASSMTFTLKSPAWTEGGRIPVQYTCQGANISPPLSWQGGPKLTQSWVLIVNDPDAPSGNWIHWILFNIPATTHLLTENLLSPPKGAQFGKNSFGKSAYSGPCPPLGKHRYYFKLYALDNILDLPAGATQSQIEPLMKDHVLTTATLIGVYDKRSSY